jgi:hypothetical protein
MVSASKRGHTVVERERRDAPDLGRAGHGIAHQRRQVGQLEPVARWEGRRTEDRHHALLPRATGDVHRLRPALGQAHQRDFRAVEDQRRGAADLEGHVAAQRRAQHDQGLVGVVAPAGRAGHHAVDDRQQQVVVPVHRVGGAAAAFVHVQRAHALARKAPETLLVRARAEGFLVEVQRRPGVLGPRIGARGHAVDTPKYPFPQPNPNPGDLA